MKLYFLAAGSIIVFFSGEIRYGIPTGKGIRKTCPPCCRPRCTFLGYKCLMKCFIVPLLLLTLVYSTAALTTDEESALEALFHSFPSLASEHPGWSSNTSLACEAPVFYGLQCSDGPDPHVLSMYATPRSSTLLGWSILVVYLHLIPPHTDYLLLIALAKDPSP
jgi:hypothetical protein